MDEQWSKIQKKAADSSNIKFMEGIMTNIFSRLPVNSLMTCKAAFNYWHRFIDNPDFIDRQLSLSEENPGYIIFPCGDANKDVYVTDCDGVITEKITDLGFEGSTSLRVICSFNGLICCISNISSSTDVIDLNIYICNPATREVLLLPKASPSGEKCSIGLAFDPITNEYKIFWFFSTAGTSYHVEDKIAVYSSITGSWKTLGTIDLFPMRSFRKQCCPLSSDNLCIDGTAYWFMSSEEDPQIPSSILSFDMEENLFTIRLPQDVIVTKHSFLVNLEGFLTLVVVDDGRKSVDTHMFYEGHGWQHESIYSIPIDDGCKCYFSAAILEHDLVLLATSDYLICNLENGSWRDFELDDDLLQNSAVVFPFAETLLRCDGRPRS